MNILLTGHGIMVAPFLLQGAASLIVSRELNGVVNCKESKRGKDIELMRKEG